LVRRFVGSEQAGADRAKRPLREGACPANGLCASYAPDGAFDFELGPRGCFACVATRELPDKTRLGVFDTEDEAQRVLAAPIAELETGRIKPRNVKSFATAGSKWLDERELLGARDVDNDRSRWDQYVVKTPFYDLALKRSGKPVVAPSEVDEGA
jgi:hypothetical protein